MTTPEYLNHQEKVKIYIYVGTKGGKWVEKKNYKGYVCSGVKESERDTWICQ